MNFSEALELLKQGKKVKRICWGATGCYIRFDESSVLSEYVRIGDEWKEDDYIICKCDLLAQDWGEYKEPLLTEEEKEYLKMIIKFSDMDIKTIEKGILGPYLILSNGIKANTTTDFKKGCFSKMEKRKQYTLKELGLDE